MARDEAAVRRAEYLRTTATAYGRFYAPLAVVSVVLVIAVLAALIVVMLLTKPGTGTPTPGLTPSGEAAVAISLCAIALTLAHVIQLRKS